MRPAYGYAQAYRYAIGVRIRSGVPVQGCGVSIIMCHGYAIRRTGTPGVPIHLGGVPIRGRPRRKGVSPRVIKSA